MGRKLSLLYWPVVALLIALVAGHSFIHWLVFIRLELIHMKTAIASFLIPAILGLAFALIVRRRFKALNLETKNGSWRDFYTFILTFVFAVPMIIATEYINTASGKLTTVTRVSDVEDYQATKYYKIKNYYADKVGIGVHSTFEVTGKYNQDFNMNIFVAVPMLDKPGEMVCKAWLGIKFHKRISSRLQPEEKERRYQIFAKECELKFDTMNLSKFSYFDRVSAADAEGGYLEAIKKNNSRPPSNTILVSLSEPFETRNGKKFEWIFGSSAIGLVVWLILIAMPKVDESQYERITAGQPDVAAQEEVKDFIGLFIPRKGFFFTPILMDINLLIYAAMVAVGLGFISFKTTDLLAWGALYGPLVKDGHWWRLVTSMFLHSGLIHVIMNMYGLMFVGLFLEPILEKKFLPIYLATGIVASIASVWWYNGQVSVGASGAIFGLYGVFLTFMVTRVYPPEFSKGFLISTVIYIGYNLLIGLFGPVDNAAHIGGLLAGIVVGLARYPTTKKIMAQRAREYEDSYASGDEVTGK